MEVNNSLNVAAERIIIQPPPKLISEYEFFMNHIKIDLERIVSDIDRNIFGGTQVVQPDHWCLIGLLHNGRVQPQHRAVHRAVGLRSRIGDRHRCVKRVVGAG